MEGLSGLNSSLEASNQLETALLIALVRMLEQYSHLLDGPFWADWDEQESIFYRSGGSHLTMPAELRDKAISALTAQGVLRVLPANFPSFGLTSRQASLAAALVKLSVVYLTINPSGGMDSLCMSAGENSFEVLDQIGLIKDGSNSRLFDWNDKGREFVRLFRNEIALIIEDLYRPGASWWPREEIRVRHFEEAMNMWLFK